MTGNPGVVLLDRRFPIWLAILDNAAFISIDTELLEGAARTRFEAAFEYVTFLNGRGYRQLFDHRTAAFSEVDPDGTDFVRRLAHAGSSRRFDRIRTDNRVGFVGGFVGIVLADLALSSSTRPLWTTVLRGLALGSVLTGLQYYQARKALTDRLRRLRDEILANTSPRQSG
jgi:hypothetical protein